MVVVIIEAHKYRVQAALSDGAAARAAEAVKLARYPAVASAGLQEVVPFAVETFGRLGRGAQRLLNSARKRVEESDDRFRGWASMALRDRWQAQLSCELQRSLFESVQAAWGKPGLPQVHGEQEEGSLMAAVLPF